MFIVHFWVGDKLEQQELVRGKARQGHLPGQGWDALVVVHLPSKQLVQILVQILTGHNMVQSYHTI